MVLDMEMKNDMGSRFIAMYNEKSVTKIMTYKIALHSLPLRGICLHLHDHRSTTSCTLCTFPTAMCIMPEGISHTACDMSTTIVPCDMSMIAVATSVIHSSDTVLRLLPA
ncbi:hypothetical protein TNCV_4202901 [Trichonephila clavipes]|uniref:Uncharacterized protein n=1 Tax=Trichonephila clavipes TaxID=2585209 RepID=A0A8X6S551_TRICX|nr:hypothetical protein TNCV_4202901 [Trichonephila clavipes]